MTHKLKDELGHSSNYQYPFQSVTQWPCNGIWMENYRCRFASFPDTFSIIPMAAHELSTFPPLGKVNVFIQENRKCEDTDKDLTV